jgi:DNA helicase HerA-like ATPase
MYLGANNEGRITLPVNDLLTHAVMLGRTGSGKTGLTIAVIEEAVQAGASVLVLDPKGDLANLGLRFTEESDYQGWVADPFDAHNRHLEGLYESGLSVPDLRRWSEATVRIYTPGDATAPVDSFPSFQPHKGPLAALREFASRNVGTLLAALDESDGKFSPARVFLTEVMLYGWSRDWATPVEEWPQYLLQPPMTSFGGMPLDDYFPKKDRQKLARSLVGFRLHAARWLNGDRLDLAKLTSTPQVAVMSMRHLSEDDRTFFTSILLNKLVDFMYATTASNKLKLLVVLDEARGYLPPHPYNPPSKAPICQLLAQGRAQGIGMVIGTQNPVDMDYKALSNVGTWFVGRLRGRDCERDLTSELKERGIHPDELQELPRRTFLLLDRDGNHRSLRSRHTLSYLRGPLELAEIARLKPKPRISVVRRLFGRTA